MTVAVNVSLNEWWLHNNTVLRTRGRHRSLVLATFELQFSRVAGMGYGRYEYGIANCSLHPANQSLKPALNSPPFSREVACEDEPDEAKFEAKFEANAIMQCNAMHGYAAFDITVQKARCCFGQRLSRTRI